MAELDIKTNDSFDDGLQRELDEACDVKGCGQSGVGCMVVGNGGKIWLCIKHEV